MTFLQKAFALFLLIIFVGAHSKAQDTKYMPGRIIIQYEDATMGISKSLPGQNQAKDMLNVMGAGPSKSILDPIMESRIQERLGAKKTVAQGNHLIEKLRRTFIYDYIGDMDAALLAAKISRMPGVAYAEPWYIHEMHYRPGDLYVGEIGHSYFEPQRFFDAWDITKGSSDIIIAIVDSGVDYTHPDLREKSWVNQGEIPAEFRSAIDRNNDGIITSMELHIWITTRNIDYNGDGVVNLRDAVHPSSPLTNSLDLDGNGYPDDILGYDFWESGYTFATIQRDNDPYGEFSMHGTHVAGLAAAHTDNADGVAGTGFNSVYMAIKAGGVRDNPATPNTDESRSIGFGYDGILYAAINGAHVINNSWGGGGYSESARTIVRLANAMGSVVVASAGNSGTFVNSYPGAYPEVLSVASTDYDGVPIGRKSGFSTYNYFVDVMATGNRGPGLSPAGVLSTWRGSNTQPLSVPTAYSYAYSSGTSMSAPIVSGLAALIADKNRGWSPERIKTQIRVTAVMADELNSVGFAGALGRGYIDAYSALAIEMPGYTVVDATLVNSNGDKASINEDAFMRYRIVNHGAAKSATAKLTTKFAGISIIGSEVAVSAATGDTITVNFPVRLNSVSNTIPLFKVEFSNTFDGYYDFNYYSYDSIFYDVIGSSTYNTSLNSFGNIGAINAIGGTGFTGYNVNTDKPVDQQFDVLFEGGLMVLSKNRIADRLRDMETSVSTGIEPRSPFVTQVTKSGLGWDMYGSGTARLRLRELTNFVSVDTSLSVKIESFVFNRPEINKALFVKYTVRNDSQTNADSTIIGLFNDIDINNSDNNSVVYSPSDSLLYVSASNQPGSPYVAVIPVGNISTLLAIDNRATGSGLNFGLYDGFSTLEKVRSLKAGRTVLTATNSDVSTVVASGPFHIRPGQEAVVGFIYVYGNTLEELRAQAAAARAYEWIQVTKPGIVTSNTEMQPEVPYATGISGNYPNPFNPSTTLAYELANSGNVDVAVYNALGQRVAVVHNGFKTAGRHQAVFDASRLGSGVYFVRMMADNRVYTHKMTLIK
jgi:serine protease